MDKIGPICRSVEDCALVFDAIYGPDGQDASVVDLPFAWPPAVRISELTIGYVASAFEEEHEGAALSTLDGLRATKRRYRRLEQGRTFCIDVWERPAAAHGTIVAEVEADSMEELERILLPSWAEREVTDDASYSAIAIAARR